MSFSPTFHTLDNGLQITLESRPDVHSVSICCMIGCGSQHDFKKKSGMAHLLEHMLFRSITSGENKQILENFIYSGGFVNAVTMLDRTAFFIQCYYEDLPKVFNLLNQLTKKLEMDQESFALEKQIVLQEMFMYGEDGDYQWQRIKYNMLGGDETLKHYAIGTAKNLKRIKLEDLHEMHQKYYISAKTHLSVVGKFDPEYVLDMIQNTLYFDSLNHSDEGNHTFEVSGPVFKTASDSRFSQLGLSIRVPRNEMEHIGCLELFFSLIAESPSSRLFKRLREDEGLVYSIEGNMDLSDNINTIDIFTISKNKIMKKVIFSIIDEISKIKNDPFGIYQFDEIKANLIKRRIIEFDDIRYAAGWYAQNSFIKINNHSLKSLTLEIKKIEKGEFLQYVRRVLVPENIFLYLLGYIYPWQRSQVRKKLKNLNNH